MNEKVKISEEDQAAIDRLGITSSPKQVYYYKQHRYDRLADALRFAERDSASSETKIS